MLLYSSMKNIQTDRQTEQRVGRKDQEEQERVRVRVIGIERGILQLKSAMSDRESDNQRVIIQHIYLNVKSTTNLRTKA